jgi:hypothetical protein
LYLTLKRTGIASGVRREQRCLAELKVPGNKMQLGEAKNSGISLDFSRNCKKTLGKPAINRKNTEEIQEKYPMMGLICVEVVFLQTTT